LAQGAEDLKDYSLHFDLTVPFARYVLDRESELTFPFKRYQIQPVRRGERAQKGRFREFFQCDIDVIWRKDSNHSYLYYDAEVIFTLSQTLQHILTTMAIEDTPVMHISNRKLLVGFLRSLISESEVPVVSSLIDKYQKIGQDTFIASLGDLGLYPEVVQKILDFITMKVDKDSLQKVATLADTPLFQEGLNELKEVVSLLETFQSSCSQTCPYVIDFQIIRGLDYYTGTVFEGMLQNDASLGAISAGGRYGELTGYIDAKRDDFAGVGGTLGLSRLLAKIFDEQTSSHNTVSEYLFVNFPETLDTTLTLATKLQSE
jgi:histidyl-tRNA synthetase